MIFIYGIYHNTTDESESDEVDTSKNETTSDEISSDTKESDSSENEDEKEKSDIPSSEEASSDEKETDTNDEEASSDETPGSTNEESTEEITSITTSEEASDVSNTETQIIEEATKRSNLIVSFRQLNQFSFSSGTISFMFYALVTDALKASFQIKIKVNLIKINGEREDEATEIPCSLLKDVSPAEGQTLQGDFRCSISGLNEEYYSLRFNSSDSISGIPEDETLLDPVLTAESVSKKELLDFSLEENQKENKIPATFTTTGTKEESCKTDGKFIITGALNKEVGNDVKFIIPLTYPEGISVSCSLDKKEKGDSQITCQIDRELDNNKIIFEQVTIKDGKDEILILKGLSSENEITCLNGLLLKSEKRTQIQVSFRQVSHLVDNGSNGFSFFFASFVSQALTAGTTINIKIKVLIGQNKLEKTSICTLQRDVEPKDGQPAQGDFQCNAILDEKEYKEIDLTNTESVKISSDNEEIAGVSDLEEDQISPLATDKAISETNAIKESENITELAECLDYSLEENKEKIPPSLEISSVENIKEWGPKGKFRIRGKFSSNINQEMTFNLPLSFPTTSIKCKVYEARADEEVEIICKVQKGFKLVKSFVIEKRMIKRRFKEMVLVKSKSFNLGSESLACENYNIKKYERAKGKQKLNLSFLQLSKFKPQGRRANFFMALVKNHKQKFENVNLKAIVKVLKSTNLRILQEDILVNLPITCEINNASDTAGGFNCLSTEAEGTPINLQIKTDDADISGIPDDAEPSELNKDYSKLENVESIDKLPNVTITSIDGSNCENNGEYIIKGNFDNGILEDASNVEIPFGYPDSSGLCDIKVNNKDVTMKCQNKEKFDYSNVLFEPIVVHDSEGKDIFKLNSYTNIESLSCAISINSVPTIKNGSNSNSTDNYDYYNLPMRKRSSKGLSGGTIAAIIIALVVALAILGALVWLFNSDSCSKNASQVHTSIQSIDSKANMNPQ